MASAEDRKMELERKKQKLAEIREEKKRREDERRRQTLPVSSTHNGACRGPRRLCSGLSPSPSHAKMEEILDSVGISPQPQLHIDRPASPELKNGAMANRDLPENPGRFVTSARIQTLVKTDLQPIIVAPRDNAAYCKTTQTDEERHSLAEFSDGSQEDFYDNEFLSDKPDRDLNLDESPTREIAQFLPNFNFVRNAHHAAVTEVEKERNVESEMKKPPELSESEKTRILSRPGFLHFLDYSTRVMERALTEEVNIFVDYSRDVTDDKSREGLTALTESRCFSSPLSCNRSVTGLDASCQHPELLVVAYDHCDSSSTQADGLVLVWNSRFKKQTPEYILHCQSRVTSVAFARFHPHLILAGCYSGQICLWDNRVNKKTPVHKSPLATTAHTHAIYSLAVVGTTNAHNLVSISTDGKLCSWSVDNLNTPIEAMDLTWKQGRQVPVTCMAFPMNDVNNFIVGSEDGVVYATCRHGNKGGSVGDAFEGHSAPISGVDYHRAVGAVDLSHLFLSSSLDWTVKLWSNKETRPICSFEKHGAYVLDVAWSPVHPSVFASVDAHGLLCLWNLNEDVETPITQIVIGNGAASLCKVIWTDNGQHLTVGDSDGRIWVYDVQEALCSPRPEEWTKFTRTIREIHQANVEAEELAETMNRIGTGTSAAIVGASVSPRSNW